MADFRRALEEAETLLADGAHTDEAGRRIERRLAARGRRHEATWGRWVALASAATAVAALAVVLWVKPFGSDPGGEGTFGGATDVRSGVAFEDDDDRASPPRAQSEEVPVWGGATQTGSQAAGVATGGPPATSDPRPLATAPPPPSGGTGKIVGIAIGGTCAFAVDGAVKGTASSIRIDVPVGTHTVSCQPPGGAVRSKTVVVTADKPGIASFRL